MTHWGDAPVLRTIRLLLLGDTHLGFDQPRRPRVERRRRGADFLANYHRALQPAKDGEVDLVVHGGDVFNRSKASSDLVMDAFEPLKAIANRGIPVFLVPGNHERSKIPSPLLAIHPNIHIFDQPKTAFVTKRGLKVACMGFPYVRRGLRTSFMDVLSDCGSQAAPADIRLLCLHHCIEGATVGPNDYVFRRGDDVIVGADLPTDVAAVLSGHIHRHQVLTTDLSGRQLPAPVFYAGSVERTSFAERDEQKGFMILEMEADGSPGGKVSNWQFHKLPTRPMTQMEAPTDCHSSDDAQHWLRGLARDTVADTILRIRVPQASRTFWLPQLSAPSLRKLFRPSVNVEVAVVAARSNRTVPTKQAPARTLKIEVPGSKHLPSTPGQLNGWAQRRGVWGEAAIEKR